MMNNCRLLAISLVLLVFTAFLSSVPLYANQTRGNSHNVAKWAVVLSPGPKPGIPWGGYHITIAGYSKANGGLSKKYFLEGAYKSLFHGKPWHLHGNLPNFLKWNGTYTQIFQSHTLDELSDKLVSGGFDKIKGPKQGKVPWHISLQTDHAGSKRIIDEFKRGKTNWYLWQVPESSKACQSYGTGCPSWQKIH